MNYELIVILKVFFVGFFINLLYEVLHSVLYKTCLDASLKKYTRLILKAAFFDGLIIAIIYFFTSIIFDVQNIFQNFLASASFVAAGLMFAYLWEIYSLKKKKWEYSEKMLVIFGVGITPLFQLALTGLLSICLVFYF